MSRSGIPSAFNPSRYPEGKGRDVVFEYTRFAQMIHDYLPDNDSNRYAMERLLESLDHAIHSLVNDDGESQSAEEKHSLSAIHEQETVDSYYDTLPDYVKHNNPNYLHPSYGIQVKVGRSVEGFTDIDRAKLRRLMAHRMHGYGE